MLEKLLRRLSPTFEIPINTSIPTSRLLPLRSTRQKRQRAPSRLGAQMNLMTKRAKNPMKNKTSILQEKKTVFLAALVSGLMAGCGTTPPPLPSGERVPVNHYEGQWKPQKDLNTRHETPQEKAERLRLKRLKEIQRQNEFKEKNPERAKDEAGRPAAQNAEALRRSASADPAELHAVK